MSTALIARAGDVTARSADGAALMRIRVIAGPLSAAVIGLTLALGQWLVVGQATRSAHWAAGLGWIGLTAGAAGLAAFVAQFLFPAVLFAAALFLGAGQGSGFVGLTPTGFSVLGIVFLILAGALGGFGIGGAVADRAARQPPGGRLDPGACRQPSGRALVLMGGFTGN